MCVLEDRLHSWTRSERRHLLGLPSAAGRQPEFPRRSDGEGKKKSLCYNSLLPRYSEEIHRSIRLAPSLSGQSA
jgi:hypothetical protein